MLTNEVTFDFYVFGPLMEYGICGNVNGIGVVSIEWTGPERNNPKFTKKSLKPNYLIARG